MTFERVYERHFASLYRYAHRFTGDPDEAADATQEAFCRFLQATVPEDEARPWLFRVVTNLLRDRARGGRRRARLLRRWSDPPGETPADEAERALKVRRVREALAGLDVRERQMLLMREEGFSHVEIAAVAGVAPGSVGALLSRARQRFKEVYERR